MRTLTVFTPTYNRADLLTRCYESMKRQTNQTFIWMIIDDGSSDNTRELVNKWLQEEHDFLLEYYYKKNGGLHTAYNEAIAHIETPLCVCIDSDDFMPDNAVEVILDFWDKYGSDDEFFVQCLRDRFCQHGFACAGFAFDQQRFLQCDGDIYGTHQLFAGYVVFAALECHIHNGFSAFLVFLFAYE